MEFDQTTVEIPRRWPGPAAPRQHSTPLSVAPGASSSTAQRRGLAPVVHDAAHDGFPAVRSAFAGLPPVSVSPVLKPE